MKKYELALVLSEKVEDDVRAATLDRAKDYIARYGGTVTNVDERGKTRLAYEINKMTEAYYYYVDFDAEPEAPAKIEEEVRIMDNVLRFLIISKDEEEKNKEK